MKKMNRKGFTLIELLVVIAIIGLLSTMAVISLNSARAKSRDAKRLSDVKQLATTLSLAAADDETATLGCAADALTTSCNAPAQVQAEFPKFTDPTGGAACTCASTAPCSYSIAANSTTVGSSSVRFFLENASGGLTRGVHTINTEGIFNSCF